MALKVIGSGLGRTGTLSTKLALEQLGFGPTHHMVEVFMNPQTVPLWVDAGDGKPDWDAIFAGYNSMVDHPGCIHWRSLAAFYPDAKVLHTVREPEKWYESTQATIFGPRPPGGTRPPAMERFMEQLYGWYGGDVHDRRTMLEVFERHTAEVVAEIPKERLLVFDVREGWEPLCAFLGVPVPDTPYPRENSTRQFQAAMTSGGPARLLGEKA
jgi:hypothetical protein